MSGCGLRSKPADGMMPDVKSRVKYYGRSFGHRFFPWFSGSIAFLRVSRGFRSLGEVGDYIVPGAMWSWGGPMNGQAGRCDIVRRLRGVVDFDAVVETGTYQGASTGFLADTLGCAAWTVESDPRVFRFAERRYTGRDDITVVCGDSRSFLADLQVPSSDQVFVYLDAHWESDLPLWDEVGIIYSKWPQAIVMVDDFAVPGDEGYGFDDYGDGNRLVIDELRQHLPSGVEVWFPTLPSGQETGAVRGSCVLAPTGVVLDECGLGRRAV